MRLTVLVGAPLLAATPILAQPTFLITQGGEMYRYQSGVVQSYQFNDIIDGMTTVPAGMTVGNLNGGASGGDAIAIGQTTVYRVNDPLGIPSLTPIGTRSTPNASPVFVNGHLYGIGGDPTDGSIFVEWDLQNFTETLRETTGVFGGPGGMVHVPGTPDQFYYAEFNTSMLYRYTRGFPDVSTPVGTMPQFHYVGMEMYNGTIYCSLALPGTQEFVFGTLAVDGTFAQLALLDTYDIGITGLTWVIPSPSTLGLFVAAGVLTARRRR